MKTTGIVGIIPARMGSSRFPGKPLARLLGRPMIEHVYRRTALCSMLDAVWVATCDAEIRDCVESFGGHALMTSSSHTRATERVAEAAQARDVAGAEVCVMVQGDEPMVTPEMIELALGSIRSDSSVLCVNLVTEIESESEFFDPNTIKVVADGLGDALYMSRSPIPASSKIIWRRGGAFKQVCIIPFRREALARYAALAPAPLEQAESIDMLRFLENGIHVRLVRSDYPTQSVDTPEDLAKVESMMRADPLLPRYLDRPITVSRA